VLHSAGANPARDGRRYRWLAYEMRLKRGMQLPLRVRRRAPRRYT
jgi:hypothetical protein